MITKIIVTGKTYPYAKMIESNVLSWYMFQKDFWLNIKGLVEAIRIELGTMQFILNDIDNNTIILSEKETAQQNRFIQDINNNIRDLSQFLMILGVRTLGKN